MANIKCILIKPLDGQPIGTEAEFSESDFAELKAKGAVKELAAPKNKAETAPKNKSKK